MDVENELKMKNFIALLFLIGLYQCHDNEASYPYNEGSPSDSSPDTVTITPETLKAIEIENEIEKKKIEKKKKESPLKRLTCDSILHLYRIDLEDYFSLGQDWDKVKRRLPLNDIILKQCMEKNGDPFYAIEDSLQQIYKKRNI